MGGPVQQSTFAGTIGAALAMLIIWALNTYAHAAIPAEQASAIVTIISMLLVHFVPDTQPVPTVPK